jgi:hypothetical protein
MRGKKVAFRTSLPPLSGPVANLVRNSMRSGRRRHHSRTPMTMADRNPSTGRSTRASSRALHSRSGGRSGLSVLPGDADDGRRCKLVRCRWRGPIRPYRSPRRASRGFTRAGAALARAAGVKASHLSAHVLRAVCLRLPAQALGARGPSGVAEGGGGPGATDDRRAEYRYPSPDRRGGGARR